MVNVIVGQKGSGKTKELIEAIQSAEKTENGAIVCIEKGNSLRYDVSYRVRLVDAEEYQISNFDLLTGFVSGLHAGNFDITHIFIDNLYKLLKNDRALAAEFCAWCERFGARNSINFTLAVSDSSENVDDAMRKYL